MSKKKKNINMNKLTERFESVTELSELHIKALKLITTIYDYGDIRVSDLDEFTSDDVIEATAIVSDFNEGDYSGRIGDCAMSIKSSRVIATLNNEKKVSQSDLF